MGDASVFEVGRIAGLDGTAMLIGQAWLAAGAQVRCDHEHEAYEWWPADPAQWPERVVPELQLVAELLSPDPGR